MDRSRVVEFWLELENKQQIMSNNVESEHKHMYLWYIVSLCKKVFTTCISRFTCIVTPRAFVKIWRQWSKALISALFCGNRKHLWIVFSFKVVDEFPSLSATALACVGKRHETTPFRRQTPRQWYKSWLIIVSSTHCCMAVDLLLP